MSKWPHKLSGFIVHNSVSAPYWLRQITWPGNWPLIGWYQVICVRGILKWNEWGQNDNLKIRSVRSDQRPIQKKQRDILCVSRKISINAANLNDKVCHDTVRKNYKYAGGGQGSNAQCLWPAINWLSTSYTHCLLFVNINHFEIHGNFPQLLYSLNITHLTLQSPPKGDKRWASSQCCEIGNTSGDGAMEVLNPQLFSRKGEILLYPTSQF